MYDVRSQRANVWFAGNDVIMGFIFAFYLREKAKCLATCKQYYISIKNKILLKNY